MSEQIAQPTPPAAATVKTPRRRGWGAVLFTLMVLALLSATTWAGYRFGWPWLVSQWQRLDAIEGRLDQIAQEDHSQEALVAATTAAVAPQIQARLSDERTRSERALADLHSRQAAEQLALQRQTDERMARLEAQVDRLVATDRRIWLGQEAVFLARLASQRLLVARDRDAAIALLDQADNLLREADEPRFDTARGSIARDRATLKASPKVDQVGLYARLAALIDQAELLSVRSNSVAAERPVETTPSDWLERATLGWQSALAKLSDLLVIRHRDEVLSELMTPDWESLARQNARMLLEQAQIAMLSANAALYRGSLTRAMPFLERFLASDPERVASMLDELERLKKEEVAPSLPDLAETRGALEAAANSLDPDSAP